MQSPPAPHGWRQTEADRSLLAALVDRLPEHIADAHAHLYRTAHMDPVPAFMQPPGPADSGVAEWRAHTATIVGGAERLAGGLLLPFPHPSADPGAVNRFVVEATRGYDNIRAALLATPRCSPDGVDALAEPQIGGFKVYWCYATGPGDPRQAAPSRFLPEWVWQQAHERGWFITLHLMRDAALADTDNQRELRDHCERYPNARLILAHAARGFHAPHTGAGIAALAGLDNVWFDTSAICEPEALVAVLRAFGPRRLLFGTDYPISQQRGRAITMGNGFAWVVTDRVEQWDFPDAEPVQVGLEGIRALLTAADLMNLDQRDLQDIFHDNTMRLLGFLEEDAEQGQHLFSRATELIPGGTQLLSKHPDRHAPGAWPPYFREARGIDVWDEAGRRFRDVGHHGIGAAALGYRDPDVTRAVLRRVALGSYSMLNSREEPEVAELLCALHPWAEQVRFARSGGEICAIGARIARAATGRSLLAICGYHGWHDWYLAANLGAGDALDEHLLPGLDPAGVPPELRGTSLTFHYGDAAAFDRIVADHGERLAAVVMEPCRRHHPPPGFLEHIRTETRRVGALLVFDEVSLGWRLARGGAHLRYGATPDLAIFAKSLGNGHPMAAVIGTRAAMEGAHRSFISSTYWTEGVGFAAARAVLLKMRRIDLPAHCARIGRRYLAAVLRTSAHHGVPLARDGDIDEHPHVRFEHAQAAALQTLYVRLMLQRGFLAGDGMFVSLPHTEAVIDEYEAAMDPVFAEIAAALRAGDVNERLDGGVARAGFARLTDPPAAGAKGASQPAPART